MVWYGKGSLLVGYDEFEDGYDSLYRSVQHLSQFSLKSLYGPLNMCGPINKT